VLQLTSVTTRYGAVTALDAVTLRVGEGELVALVGPNGAGKTTLLNTVAGLLRPASGSVQLSGREIAGREPADLVRSGLALVPEHRRIFKDLTVEENLKLAGATVPAKLRRARLEEVGSSFAVLRTKWTTKAGYLSGGEAQQLAVARALMSDPKLLLLDEPTLGLAPALVDVVFELLVALRGQGRTILVVEQNARRALEIADRGYVLRTGRLVAEGAGSTLAADPQLFEAFLGASGAA
jgi:branched-chain amino acid transport system ATP-binding protein